MVVVEKVQCLTVCCGGSATAREARGAKGTPHALSRSVKDSALRVGLDPNLLSLFSVLISCCYLIKYFNQ